MLQQPNFLFILIDDLGWRDLSCYGSTFYETPGLDRLAAEGMTFTDAYAACPVCSPTRASLLTGRYPARVGVTNYIGGHSTGRLIDAPYIRQLPLEEYNLARALKAGGYVTWHVGKWHLGEAPFYPQHQGFDVNIGGCHYGHPYKGYFAPWQIEHLPEGPDGEYLTDRITDEAIRLIRNHDGSKPFFLNLWHYAVHTPIQAKPEDIERFSRKAEAMGLDKQQALVEGEHFPTDQKRHLRVMRRIIQSDPGYAAMVWNLDWNIGRVLDALRETAQLDNTVVIFTSDNGGLATAEGSPTSNRPLAEGKGWMYDGGTREPLIVRYPRLIQGGSTCSVPVTSPDFYPTFLELAGLDPIPEQHCDGESFVPLLRGGSQLRRDAIFWHYPHYGNQGGTPACAIRAGDWKLIEFFEDGRAELYNLREDISESRNVAQDHPEKTNELKARLAQWRKEVQAKIPQPNPAYRPG